jgi:hypothetical protein
MLGAVRERSRRIPPKLISGFFLPALRSMFQRFAAAEGRRRAALVALGIERFRQSQHRLPTALENLVPDYLSSVPVDIVTGEAMKLEVLDKGYKVYSSGADGMVPSSRERSNEKAVSVTMQYVHHYGTERHVTRGARNLWIWRPLDALWLNHNWHLTHHENPTVPWIHLPGLGATENPKRGFLVTAYLRMWRGPRRTSERVQNKYAGRIIQ